MHFAVGHSVGLLLHRVQTLLSGKKGNLKLFLTRPRVKELFVPIVLRRKADGFLLFFFLSIFLRNQCLSNAIGDFTVKNVKLGIIHLTENRLSRNKTWCAGDIHNYMWHICAKGSFDSKFN